MIGFAVYYLTMILLFDIEDIGPFPSKKAYVQQANVGEKEVDLFDRFRYLFGMYRIEKDSAGMSVWHVRPYAALVWVCPTCLCFWVANVIGIAYTFVPESHLVIQLLGFAGFVTFLSRFHS
jgi:hypothetical protein